MKISKKIRKILIISSILILIILVSYFITIKIINSSLIDTTGEEYLLSVSENNEDHSLTLKITTKKSYADSGYDLKTKLDKKGDEYEIEILGVKETWGMAMQAVDAAYSQIDLGADYDSIKIDITNDDRKDIYQIIKKEEEITISEIQASFTSVKETEVDRFLANEFIVNCIRFYRYDNDQYCNNFYQALTDFGAIKQEGEDKKYTYDGVLNDLVPIMDKFAHDDYTLQILNNKSESLVRSDYDCNSHWDMTPERLTPSSDELTEFFIEYYDTTILLPNDWYVLTRSNNPDEEPPFTAINTPTCNKIGLGIEPLTRNEFINKPIGKDTWETAISSIELKNGTWERLIRSHETGGGKLIERCFVFIERNGTIYSLTVPKNEEQYWQAIEAIAENIIFPED